MPMTIVETRLVKYDSSAGPDGTKYDLEFDVDFTGIYDPIAAKNHVTFTPVGLSEMTISAGTEIAADAGVYAGTRKVRLVDLARDGVPGTFTISVPFDQTNVYTENPLSRKDVATFRRTPFSKPISRDRAKRVIATYREFTEQAPDNSYKIVDKPLEVFQNLPTINTTRLFITVTGYRSVYKLAETAFGVDADEEFNVVNDAPVTIDGITFAKGTLCILEIDAQRQRINGYPVIAHSWLLAYAKQGWNLKVLNAGNYEWIPGNASTPKDLRPQRIRDSSGAYRAGPWPLDKSGKALPDGFTTDQITYLNFATTQPFGFGYFNFNF